MPSMTEILREAAAAEERQERLVIEIVPIAPDRDHARSLTRPPERVTVPPEAGAISALPGHVRAR